MHYFDRKKTFVLFLRHNEIASQIQQNAKIKIIKRLQNLWLHGDCGTDLGRSACIVARNIYVINLVYGSYHHTHHIFTQLYFMIGFSNFFIFIPVTVNGDPAQQCCYRLLFEPGTGHPPTGLPEDTHWCKACHGKVQGLSLVLIWGLS